MANVIKTVLTYPLDGSNRDFNIPFEYLARKFVVVTLIGVDRKVLTINTDYRFATRTTISLTKAWGPADGYTTIELRRVTSTTDRLVDFTDGSILRAYDLNVAQIQTMHVAEEARDLTADTIGVNNDGHLDARGRRIVNLANAVDDRDAVPFGQLKTMNQNSWQARNEALQFRNEAEGFRNEASASKDAAAVSQGNAYQNQQNSLQYRNEAKQFRDEAETSRNAAAQSQGAAAQSQLAASQSQQQALAQANRAESEANRAKTEADKLSNWNSLAGAVDSVVGTEVDWKGPIGVRSAGPAIKLKIPRDDTSQYIAGYASGGGLDWFVGKSDAVPLVSLSKVGGAEATMANTQGLVRFLDKSYVKVFENGVEFSGTSYVYKAKPANSQANSITVEGVESNNVWVLTQTGADGTIVNGLRGNWYNDYYVAGGQRGGSDKFKSYRIYIYSPGVDDVAMDLTPDGRLSVSRGWTIARNGNIFGQEWGNTWLSTFLNQTFVVNVTTGARAKLGWNMGWTDLLAPSGHVQNGMTVTDRGLAGAIYVSPMYIHFRDGSSRLIATA